MPDYKSTRQWTVLRFDEGRLSPVTTDSWLQSIVELLMLGATDDTSWAREYYGDRTLGRWNTHCLLAQPRGAAALARPRHYLPTIPHGQICYRRLNNTSAFMSWTGAAVAKAGITRHMRREASLKIQLRSSVPSEAS
jgi:hypothetical protein